MRQIDNSQIVIKIRVRNTKQTLMEINIFYNSQTKLITMINKLMNKYGMIWKIKMQELERKKFQS